MVFVFCFLRKEGYGILVQRLRFAIYRLNSISLHISEGSVTIPYAASQNLAIHSCAIPEGPEDAWREIMGTQFLELLGLQTPPNMLGLLEEWVRKGIKKWKSYLQTVWKHCDGHL